MKLIIDVKSTFGSLVYLRSRDWTDFKTKEVKGQILTVGSTKTFEKLEIRLKDKTKDDMKEYKQNSEMKIDHIIANYWEMNGKKGLTFSLGEIE